MLESPDEKPRIYYHPFESAGPQVPDNAALRMLVLQELRKREEKPHNEYARQILKHLQKILKYKEKKNAERVMIILDDMRIKGIAPDHQIYHAAINAVARGGGYDHAHNLAQKMKEDGFYLSASLLVYLINICKYTNDTDRAQHYFDELLSTLPEATAPHINAFNNLLNVYVSANDEQGMLRVLDQMKQMGVAFDSFTYGIQLKLYSYQKRLDDALNIVQEMNNSGVELNRQHYSSLIGACTMPEQKETAIEFFEEMPQKGIARDAGNYEDIIRCMREAEDVSKAYEFFDRMKEARLRPSIDCHRIMLEVCELDDNNVVLQRKIFAQMQTRAKWPITPEVLEVRQRIEDKWREKLESMKQEVALARKADKERRQRLMKQGEQLREERKEARLMKKSDKKSQAKLRRIQSKREARAQKEDIFAESETLEADVEE